VCVVVGLACVLGVCVCVVCVWCVLVHEFRYYNCTTDREA
jgi:hypothetical protein